MRIKFDPRQTSLFDEVRVLGMPTDIAPKTEVQVAVATAIKPGPKPRELFVLKDEMLSHLGSDNSKIGANILAIETLKRVQSNGGTTASNEEKTQMAAYSGWGGLSKVFTSGSDCAWANDRLKELLTDSEYVSARESVLSAYYTEPAVARAMWKMVESLGFDGGRVIEPSCGSGIFIGAMPEAMRQQSNTTMIEIDQLSSSLAEAIYADRQTIVWPMGVEDLGLESNETFDLVIGNCPFGNYRVHDKRLDRLKLNIHNYFIAKSLELVRPGGIVAMITSCSSLETGSDSFWNYVQARADLKMAARLPAGAFARLGGTDVVADILIFQRRESVLSEEELTDCGRLNRKEHPKRDQCNAQYPYWNQAHMVNAKLVEQPEWLLGKLAIGSNRWGERLMVEACEDWMEKLEALSAWPSLQRGFDSEKNVNMERKRYARDPSGLKNALSNGFFFGEDGRLMSIEGSMVSATDHLPTNSIRRLEGMTRIRDCALRLLESDAMKSPLSTELRIELNSLYDGFVGQHGSLVSPTNSRLFRADNHAPLLWSLEVIDDEKETTEKADVFRQSTVSQAVLSDRADSVEDAIALSYNRHGCMDLDWMAGAMGIEKEAILDLLIADDRVFMDPETNQWVDSLTYLSGPVRRKLKVAKAALKGEHLYARNVEALTLVAPETVPLRDVAIKLGVPWIGANEIKQWLEETFSIGKRFKSHENGFSYHEVEVMHVAETSAWLVKFRFEKQAMFSSVWGTSRKSFWDILRSLLNQQTPEVFDTFTVDGKERRVINKDETLVAQDMAEKIQESFHAWVMADEKRVEELEESYNALFNGTVNRVYDGSHLVIPGLNPQIKLRDAQKNSIWRGVVSGNTLFALAVGAGKTLIQICVAQECKRLGIASKPMLVVPNHMLLAFTGEYLRAFPRAKVLAASKDELQGDLRRGLLMRIATNDWDCIIVTHATFGRIGLGSEVIKGEIQKAKMKAREAVMGVTEKNVIREASRAAKMVETKLLTLISGGKDDDLPGFEKLGIDTVLVDEADLYKNLYFFTKKKRIPGISSSCSARALDLFIKSRVIFERRGHDGHGLHFSTATPISNTIGEMFIMQTYLQEKRLRELNIDCFDAWAANFAREVTCVEVKPEGSGYRMHTRFARFVNIPELMLVFREVAEIQTKKQLKLPEPKLVGGKHSVIAVAPSAAQKAFVQILAERAEAIRNGDVTPKEDNMLAVTGDGRRAALEMRCIDPFLPPETGTKVDACIDKAYQIWRETIEQRLTQLIFCDLSVPGGGFSVYEHVKTSLIQRGVPADEIAFAQDFKTDKQKATLHRMVRSGKKRVVIGSTELMGFGTNVQDRLVAKHDLDAPWRPRDVEQRDGRICRQGNMNEWIQIWRYVTEGTFDAYMWQGLERKAEFIAQVMSNDGNARTIEDVTMQSLSYAEVKALASGNPIVIEKAGVDADVAKLTAMKSIFLKDRRNQVNEQHWIEKGIASGRDYLSVLGKIAEEAKPDLSQIVVNGQRFGDVPGAVESIRERHLLIRKKIGSSFKVWGKSSVHDLLTIGNLVVRCKSDARGGCNETIGIAGGKVEVNLASWPLREKALEEYLQDSAFMQELVSIRVDAEKRLSRRMSDLEACKEAQIIQFDHEERLQELLERQAYIDSQLEIDVDDISALELVEAD